MARERISYRDYLIHTAAATAKSLTEAIATVTSFKGEETAIRHLEQTLDMAQKLLVDYEITDPERVLPREVKTDGQ